ncbi:unnamed protein product [Chondrus crispus]|uniref:Chloride channel protein n=1 Tax=Chondrus crispus TaxID=2769 RepID=R7QI83_CHOCR|nr:unnamed protein product [Chondrus crispus]CDF37125.1 unnamed protein product [Chondrus crispus]|eukprot:XP_005716944.1 unnamed protein product [Chondrus crispus]
MQAAAPDTYTPIGDAVDNASNLASASTASAHEKTPLIAIPAPTDPSPAQRSFPRLLEEPAGPDIDVHNRFGFQAFFDDITNLQSGTVPVSLFIAAVIGVLCGVAAFLYYTMLEFFLEFLWKTLPEQLAESFPMWLPCFHWVWIPIVGMICAILVGVSIKVMGFPGDLAYTVKCVHKMGYVPIGHAPAMVASSQLSILGGGSLGPEAPLVAICASIAGWVSIYLFKQKYKNVVRKHTLCGMACALAAFFGVPLGGSLFALEINSRLGYEYFEHALEAIFSGVTCLVVFRGMAGLPIGPIYFFTPETLKDSSAKLVCIGAILGLVGAGIAAIFAHGHWAVVKKLDQFNISSDPLKLSIFGGVGVVTLGLLIPQTFFWGEFEMQTIGSLSPASSLPHIWPTSGLNGFEITGFTTAFIVGVAKLIAISFTVAGGYRGGFIFPFFAAGAAFGRAICFLFPSIPPVVAILSVAAGINVAITRTALATPLILAGLAGEVNATSPVLAASLCAVFATYYMVCTPFLSSARRTISTFLLNLATNVALIISFAPFFNSTYSLSFSLSKAVKRSSNLSCILTHSWVSGERRTRARKLSMSFHPRVVQTSRVPRFLIVWLAKLLACTEPTPMCLVITAG